MKGFRIKTVSSQPILVDQAWFYLHTQTNQSRYQRVIPACGKFNQKQLNQTRKKSFD